MKKKYIQYKSGLLIGLLSLSTLCTLSSCANTRPELGSSNEEKASWKKGDTAKKAAALVTAGALLATGSATIGYYNGYNSGHNDGYRNGISRGCSNNSSSNSTSYSNYSNSSQGKSYTQPNSTGRGTMEGFSDPYGKKKK
ncbi:hypothetical protein [Cardinium endosymbiont of Nabis limbatus]|uniref:hypothetical protein n=1 Tax=Cardinium endosymbiont of Nabis limbatus TaxID=3066217 RepID=UPI003AF3FCAA